MGNNVKGTYDVRHGFKDFRHYRNIYQRNCEDSRYAPTVQK